MQLNTNVTYQTNFIFDNFIAQIQEIEKVSHLISGREGFDKINKAVQEIKEETESLLRTNFEIWCGQHSTAVKSGDLR